MSAQIAPTPIQPVNVAEYKPTLSEQGKSGAAGAIVANLKAQQAAADAPKPAPESTPEPKPAVTTEKQSLLAEPEPAPESKPDPKAEKQKLKAAQWKEVNDARAAAEVERDEFKTKYEATKKLAAERDALLPLKDELAKTKAELRAASIERDPDFQKEFVQGRETKLANVKKAGAELGVDGELLGKIMAEPNAISRMKMMKDAGMDTMEMIIIRDACAEVDHIDQRKAAEMERWRNSEAAQNYAETKLLRQEEEQRASISSAFDAMLPKIAERFPQFRENGNAERNAQVAEDIAFARSIALGEASQEDQAATPYLAVAARRLKLDNQALYDENKKLKSIVAEYEKGTPGVAGGSVADDHTPSDGKPVGILARSKQWFGGTK